VEQELARVHDAYFLLGIATKSADMLPFLTVAADRSFGLERRIQTLIEIAAVRCHDLQLSIGTHALEEPPHRTTIDGRAGSGVAVETVY
jgi:hypothetical protein